MNTVTIGTLTIVSTKNNERWGHMRQGPGLHDGKFLIAQGAKHRYGCVGNKHKKSTKRPSWRIENSLIRGWVRSKTDDFFNLAVCQTLQGSRLIISGMKQSPQVPKYFLGIRPDPASSLHSTNPSSPPRAHQRPHLIRAW